MTGILIIQNHEKSFLCLERARNLLQNGICKKAQHVVGQETQELILYMQLLYYYSLRSITNYCMKEITTMYTSHCYYDVPRIN